VRSPGSAARRRGRPRRSRTRTGRPGRPGGDGDRGPACRPRGSGSWPRRSRAGAADRRQARLEQVVPQPVAIGLDGTRCGSVPASACRAPTYDGASTTTSSPASTRARASRSSACCEPVVISTSSASHSPPRAAYVSATHWRRAGIPRSGRTGWPRPVAPGAGQHRVGGLPQPRDGKLSGDGRPPASERTSERLVRCNRSRMTDEVALRPRRESSQPDRRLVGPAVLLAPGSWVTGRLTATAWPPAQRGQAGSRPRSARRERGAVRGAPNPDRPGRCPPCVLPIPARSTVAAGEQHEAAGSVTRRFRPVGRPGRDHARPRWTSLADHDQRARNGHEVGTEGMDHGSSL
jgi:hypothetical protein